ncbi:Guanylate-binding protein 6, partial [Myotis brandtii]
GFPLGSTVQSETKGIWMCCVPHPSNPNHTLVLLDTEGLGDVAKNWIRQQFRQQSDNFCYYISTHAKTKTLREGVKVTGNRLGTLVVTYIDTINKGSVPCLENAVTTLAQLENSVAVQKAADHYSEQMGQRVIFPTDTLQELLDLHAAIAIFLEHSFKDDQSEFQKKLTEIIKNKKESLLLKNEEASEKYCQYVLDQLSMALMESISDGTFSVSGGHKNYRRAKERIERQYWEVPRKGVKATEVFQRFLTSQVSIEKSILQADKALTQGEKAITEERAKKEQAEKEQEWLRQKHKEQQQQIEAQNRSLEENIVQLRKKLEKDRDEALREQTRILEQKLKIQEELLNEGFRKKSDEMEAEINRLKNLIESTKKDKTPWIARALDTLADGLTATLAIPGKLIGKGLNALSSLFK